MTGPQGEAGREVRIVQANNRNEVVVQKHELTTT